MCYVLDVLCIGLCFEYIDVLINVQVILPRDLSHLRAFNSSTILISSYKVTVKNKS